MDKNELYRLVDGIFGKAMPYLEKHFEAYNVNQQIIILQTLIKLEFSVDSLFPKFYSKLEKSYQERRLHEVIKFHDKFVNEDIDLVFELVNVLNKGFKNVDYITTTRNSGDLVPAVIDCYIKHIESNHSLAFPKSKQIDLKLRSLFPDDSSREKFNNKILDIIMNELTYMKDGYLKAKPSNLLFSLKEISPSE
mmetsp:Transcript_26412/g.30537  ORF Transcript_26412/g.30537 Transcript_26412/m.30537 type:complete len:193 (+) Transcript_26412:907-1485(+)